MKTCFVCGQCGQCHDLASPFDPPDCPACGPALQCVEVRLPLGPVREMHWLLSYIDLPGVSIVVGFTTGEDIEARAPAALRDRLTEQIQDYVDIAYARPFVPPKTLPDDCAQLVTHIVTRCSHELSAAYRELGATHPRDHWYASAVLSVLRHTGTTDADTAETALRAFLNRRLH